MPRTVDFVAANIVFRHVASWVGCECVSSVCDVLVALIKAQLVQRSDKFVDLRPFSNTVYGV